ncbi:hypothetical protein GALMADRAFT_77650 [Galerina marginata CBS 339.88]|uniref:Uncharacterized protein n=1 Tax=Galerina marginata (strain CBS 339.88) TaxID=685588 RepID=A0A067SR44_GALM3|nr:hypothetical protein GALMADRAFT_77650 [Galerina marginata CBS 339.88]
MLIFSVSFQFFRMSPRRGQKLLTLLGGCDHIFEFCSVHWVSHMISTVQLPDPGGLIQSLTLPHQGGLGYLCF